MTAILKYKGGCHCGNVAFEVVAPRKLTVMECNCSVCMKKQSRHFIVPSSNFKLVSGHTSLTTYTFGTHQAKHMFCSTCGVQSFHIPQTNPDKIAIMPHCLDDPLSLNFRIESLDGQNLEVGLKKAKKVTKCKRRCQKMQVVTHL